LSNGDIVVVDRSSNAVEGQLVVAVEEGLLKLIKLGASDTAHQRTFPTEIWGVSKWALKKL
jgi:phage repressor protein C with HTH and peptisase S24 domain